jgi:nucleoid-associated protein Lsr2
MAEKVTVELVDDIDGSRAVETVEFRIDGSSYLIDLSSRNAMKLRQHLAEFISAGRRSEQASATPTTVASNTVSASKRQENQTVREWAREAGHSVADRGRLPQELLIRFQAAKETS